MTQVLSLLHQTMLHARTTEQLARPLLAILNTVTGMESTYLTRIDAEQDEQQIAFARNAGAMQIPEGLTVPWCDTLCKRALDSGTPYTDDVPIRWGDSEAARELGIQTYVSAPVRTQDGQLLGTLCAASKERLALPGAAEEVLGVFSSLLGSFLEREILVEQLREANTYLSSLAQTDALTGLPNRRAILEALSRALDNSRRDGSHVLVGSIDLNGFKVINDRFGHQVGDLFLRTMGQQLLNAVRGEDLVGRLGGDEFVVLAQGASALPAEAEHQAQVLQERLFQASRGNFDLGGHVIVSKGASVGVVAVKADAGGADGALLLADAAMYKVKQPRLGDQQAARTPTLRPIRNR